MSRADRPSGAAASLGPSALVPEVQLRARSRRLCRRYRRPCPRRRLRIRGGADVDGLPRRPGAALGPEPPGRARPVRGANATILRTLVDVADVAPTKAAQPDEPFDPRLPLRRPRRVGPERAAARHGDADHDLGHAEVGERGQGTDVPADEDGRLPELRPRARRPLLGPPPRIPVRPLLRDLERVEPRQFLARSSTQKGKIVGPAPTRSSPLPATRGSRRESRRRCGDRRDVVQRPGQEARRARPIDAPGTFAKLLAQANKKLKFDAWAQHPYRFR